MSWSRNADNLFETKVQLFATVLAHVCTTVINIEYLCPALFKPERQPVIVPQAQSHSASFTKRCENSQ